MMFTIIITRTNLEIIRRYVVTVLNKLFIRVTLLVVVLGLTACASGIFVTTPFEDSGSWTVIQPYHHSLAGIGGGAIHGSILVPDTQENLVASQALLMALQDNQLSVIEPELGLDGIIPPNLSWETDVAPIAMNAVSVHNEMEHGLILGPAQYGIKYIGMHDTKDYMFRFKISAHLYQRGALSGWSSVSDDHYSGQFFVKRLESAIKAKLVERVE